MSLLNLIVVPLVVVLFFESSAQNPVSQTPFPTDGSSFLCDPLLWPFYHGIASGDPLPEAVVIWTRVTPGNKEEVTVKWEMALDEHFSHIEATGEVTTFTERDFTVKVDVTNLRPGTYYYYRFEAFGIKSPIGRTKTARDVSRTGPAMFTRRTSPISAYPSPNEEVKLAVVSCNNYEAGYFNAFARIAEIPDLDAVVHLGDYIYEYGVGHYGDTTLHRFHLPEHELVTLQDYRTRFAQYRLDPDMQAAHQMHPFICVWDDHEIANNAYSDGAENHQPDESNFALRKADATKAYYEWLPVREGKTIYRQFSFGGIADLFMLDERLEGREAPAESKRPKKLRAERSMLGKRQLDWLKSGLKTSTARWKIIGNQVLFAELNVLPVFPKIFLNFDAWDGYPTERQAIKDFLSVNEIPNAVFITGDTHSSWCFDIPLDFKKYKKKRSGKIIAREFATPSITSANVDELKSIKSVRRLENLLSSPTVNPHLRYIDLRQHGYLLLTFTPYDAVAEWRFMEDIRCRNNGEYIGEKRVVKAENPEEPKGEAAIESKMSIH